MKQVKLMLAGLLMSAAVFSQTADEVIQKHIAATGGAENWKKINSVVMQGAMNVMGRDIDLTISQLHNKGMRTEINVSGMVNYELMTPTYGYRYYPIQGQTKPEPLTADEVKQNIDDLDLQGSLIDYAAKGHTVELLGSEEIEGTDCYKVRLTRKNGSPQTLYIDKSTNEIIRTTTTRKVNGQEVEMKSDLSDYKTVNGVRMPHSITQPFGTVTIKTIKVNEPVDEALFAVPK